MKIRLPSALMNDGNQGGIETTASSDDISCSSENSTGNRSVRSFLSRSRSRSRSRSISRLRQRSRSLRGDKASNAANANANAKSNANANGTTLKRPKSPTKRIMKRLQKSFTSSSSPKKNIGNPDDEKENTIPSSSSSSIDTNTGNGNSHGTEMPPVDATIVSIADRAVARNFPSSYIRPVPIDREEIYDSLADNEDGKMEGANATLNDGVAKKLFKEKADESTTNGGNILAIGEPSDESKDDEVIDYVETNPEGSPFSVCPSNSLLPPLDDEGDDECGEDGDGNGCPKMLFPETHTGEQGRSDDAIKSPKVPKDHKETSTKAYLPPPTPPPPPTTNHCVTSPLSPDSALFSGDDAASSSCDSSISMGRGSLLFNSDDGSNDHIASLTKSTFKPPREVVTITSYPVVASNSDMPHTTHRRRRKQKKELNLKATKIVSKLGGEKEGPGENAKLQSRAKRNKGSNSSYCSSTGDCVEDDETKTAKELAAKLVVDLEALREENEKHVSKNRRLEAKLQIIKAQQDEHMVHRGRLIKACLYTAPVFVLCGGLDAFLATILLVWVLIEVESYLDGNEGHDGEEEDGEDDDSQDVGEDGSDVESFGDDGSSMSL